MVSNYTKAKKDVLSAYQDFLELVTRIKGGKDTSYDLLLAGLAKQAEHIMQDKFLLMVVGEANSGKSTFINAYLGEEILPMDIKQCTSAIVEIRYGARFTLTATYADDRVVMLDDEGEIKAFLSSNAAIDDNYRGIPVPVINIEILMHKKDKRVTEREITDLLANIETENLYNLPKEEYEAKVRAYIKEKQPLWRDIVKKIEITYPFEDTDLKNIEIVDTPGVNADGRVGDITNKYVEAANAVMFLKPITGTVLEATSFRNFLQTKSADRNKDAMFLLLTRAANDTPDNVERIYEEALRQFPGINKSQIITVDSKAELFYNTASRLTSEALEDYLMQLNRERKLDSFVRLAWLDAEGFREKFMDILKELSNFGVVDDALNRFAHKAQYLALSGLLGRMRQVLQVISANLKDSITTYRQKAKDPAALNKRLNLLKKELENLTRTINKDVDEIARRYAKSNGMIEQRANQVIEQYKQEIEALDEEYSSSLDELEKISFQKIDQLAQFEDELQKNIVAECDKALVALSDKGGIQYAALKPNFTKESFEEIKEEMRKSDQAQETYYYTTGITFEKTHSASRFSQKKYFNLVKDSIQSRIDNIRNQAVKDLREFVIRTTGIYTEELNRNAGIKRNEYDAILQEKQSEEQLQDTISGLEKLAEQLPPLDERIAGLKGGIEQYVGQ